MSDWSGWAAMTGVDKKLWESEWVAFIVATSPRGNALGRVATLSLALWSQQSLSTIPICSLVPLFLTHAEFEPMKESNETRLEPADNFRVLPWGRLRFNGWDYSILPSACLLHLVLFAWFKKNRGGENWKAASQRPVAPFTFVSLSCVSNTLRCPTLSIRASAQV